MTTLTYSAENERLKRRYFGYLRAAKRYSDGSVDEAAKAPHRFETYTRFRDFRKFHIEQANGFKKHLAESRNATGKPLAKATVYGTLSIFARFFIGWQISRATARSSYIPTPTISRFPRRTSASPRRKVSGPSRALSRCSTCCGPCRLLPRSESATGPSSRSPF